MLSHEEYGNCLHYIERPTDTELDYMYKQALMFLFISKGEGFGLPLIEASVYNTPVACSEIASFEEIGGNHVLYVDIETTDKLVVDLKRCFELISNGLAPESNEISKLSWSESAEQLLRVVVDQNWYKIY